MGDGVDTSDAVRHLARLRKQGWPPGASALLTAMTAGTWAPARKFDLYGDLAGTGNCSCGARADDLHRIWGQCQDKEKHPAFTKSEHL
eukprot:6129811-Pyramimonas_sp.AAC.1